MSIKVGAMKYGSRTNGWADDLNLSPDGLGIGAIKDLIRANQRELDNGVRALAEKRAEADKLKPLVLKGDENARDKMYDLEADIDELKEGNKNCEKDVKYYQKELEKLQVKKKSK